ncbi:MFS transporter [Flavisphingomonas formosensis]|uniref:MFS transporter n=1 Tax=Flavisphingomonas formosensis TaxID=861534 RepID=UPI0012FC9FCC|nr:MFS transporter [Sphingomonas formosensis]
MSRRPAEKGILHKPTSAQRRAALLALAIAYGFNTADRQLLSILAGSVKADLQLSDMQLGFMGGVAFALFYASCSPPLAWLADRWSRAWVITISLGLWSLFTAACGLVQNATQLFLCRLGVGFGEAGGTAPSFSLVCAYYPANQRARATALLNFAAPLGVALGPLAAAMVADALDWRAAFLIAGVLGCLFVPVFRWTVHDPAGLSVDRAHTGVSEISAADRRSPLKRLLSSSSFWLLTTAAALSSMVLQGVLFWLPSFLERTHGLVLKERAILFGVVTASAGVAGNWASGWIVDRLGPHRQICALLPAAAGLIAIPAYALALTASTAALATPFLFVGWQ